MKANDLIVVLLGGSYFVEEKQALFVAKNRLFSLKLIYLLLPYFQIPPVY